MLNKMASVLLGRHRLEHQSPAQALYRASPWYIQNLLMSADGLVMSRRINAPQVRRHLSELLQSQWWSPDELAAMQTRKLQALIQHTYHNVPYYRQLFDRLHLEPEDIRGPGDLRKLPLLSKKDLRDNGEQLIARNIDRRKLIQHSTSGTTGSPLTLWVTDENEMMERALNLRVRGWAGWRPGERRATFGGFEVVPLTQRGLPLWRHDWPENRLFFSVYHMTHDNLDQYLDALRAFRPNVIEGYPVQLALLALRLERTHQTLPLKAVFPFANILYQDHRRLIEERFECKVVDWYGLSERAASAGQCERTDGYHVSAEKTIVEIVRSDGAPASQGESGQIVGTNLEEYGMPLIRYCTGDVSAFRPEPCPCGRGLPLIEQVRTRTMDIIVTPDGRLLDSAPFDFILENHTAVEKTRIIQDKLHELTVLIVPAESYSAIDGDVILAGCRDAMGPDVKITLRLVDDLPLNAAGKYPVVISKVHGALEPSFESFVRPKDDD